MRFKAEIMTTIGAIRMHSILFMLIGWYTVCESVSPFRWRSNGVNNGVMLNTANVPVTFTPAITPIITPNGHGHGATQADIVYGSQFADAPKLNYNHNYHNVHQTQQLLTAPYAQHYAQNHGVGHTYRRRSRNPFEVIYEWRQLDFEYSTCML